MFAKPFFSVIIPTYNYANLLPDAIESVLQQTYEDFELLIQDNVSTDNTDEVIKNYDDARISYSKNSSNLGIFGNLNQLCARSKGQYIKILCADDMLSKWCLETVHKVLQEHDFQYKLISLRETSDRLQIINMPSIEAVETFTVSRHTLFSYLAEENHWGGGLAELCVERDFFEAHGFFGEFNKAKDFSKDILTWLEMVLKTDVLMITHPLVFQRAHSGQARYKLARITQLREMLAFFYGRERELHGYPDFVRGRSLYLERYVLSHYLYGIKAVFSGHGLTYLREVRQLLEQFSYRGGFPWLLAASKIRRCFLS